MTLGELRDYVDQQRDLGNISHHVYSTLIDGIDALEQKSILDMVRAEIEQTDFDFGDFYDHTNTIREMVLKVIDRCEDDWE